MRRLLALLVLALLTVACTDDPAELETGSDMVDLIESGMSTTSAPVTSTTEAPTTTAPPTTSLATTTVAPTTTEPLGMCGELIPVVTDEGTLCLTPEQAEWGIDVDPFWEGELPPIVVAGDDGSLVRLDPNDTGGLDTTPLPPIDGWVVELRAAADGTLVARRHVDAEEEYWSEVVIVRPDGTEELIPRSVFLYDVTVVDGREVALVSDIPYGRLDEADLLRAVDLDRPDETVRDLGLASAESMEVQHAVVRDGTMLWSGWVEDTEFVEVEPAGSGTVIDFAGHLTPGEPPLVTAATLGPDGRTLTWAEGPAHSQLEDEFVPAPWVIRSIDIESRAEILYWPISDPIADPAELTVASIHDLEDFIIVNRTGWVGENWVSYPALVIDFTVEEPETWELPVAGLAAPIPVAG